MFVGTWRVINTINTVGDEYVVMGFNPNSPTPYATWSGMIKDGVYDFGSGSYFDTKLDAWNDLMNRVERFYR